MNFRVFFDFFSEFRPLKESFVFYFQFLNIFMGKRMSASASACMSVWRRRCSVVKPPVHKEATRLKGSVKVALKNLFKKSS